MNWTGGRLHRHSKANANAKIRAQKQYFARARLQSKSRCPPPALSSFSILQGLEHDNSRPLFKDRSTFVQRDVPLKPSFEALGQSLIAAKSRFIDTKSHQKSITKDELYHENSKVDKSDLDLTSVESYQNKTRLAGQKLQAISKDVSKTSSNDDLAKIKHELLQRADWTGLSATKPVKIQFTTAKETEMIGRPRKIQRLDGRQPRTIPRKIYDRSKRYSKPEIRIFPENPTVRGDENLSIRIGSTIHQTQATQESVLRRFKLPSMKSISTESMLLDKHDPYAPQNPDCDTHGTGRHHGGRFGPLETENILDNGTRTIPLNEALDLESFDQVLQRSMSSSGIRSTVSRSNETSHWPQNVSGECTSSMQALRSSDVQSCSSQSPSQQHMVSQDSTPNSRLTQQKSLSRSCNKDLSFPPRAQCIAIDTPMSNELDLCSPTTSLARSDPTKRSKSTLVNQPSNIPQSAGFVQHPLRIEQPASSIRVEYGPRALSRTSNHCMSPQIETNSQKLRQPAPTIPSNQAQVSRPNQIRTLQQNHSSHDVPVQDEDISWIDKTSEALIKSARYEHFDQLTNDFAFGPPPLPSPVVKKHVAKRNPKQKHQKTIDPSEKKRLAYTHLVATSSSPTRNGSTAANETILTPKQKGVSHGGSLLLDSETDFLSRLSPMEGYLDERLVSISANNNAPRTERSLFSLPSTISAPRSSSKSLLPGNQAVAPPKRGAGLAFGLEESPSQIKRVLLPTIWQPSPSKDQLNM